MTHTTHHLPKITDAQRMTITKIAAQLQELAIQVEDIAEPVKAAERATSTHERMSGDADDIFYVAVALGGAANDIGSAVANLREAIARWAELPT